ncbi:MAG: S9 family peptidase [Salinibacter sp.]|uniref:S9 family peptidase n=1 Tax=Salinibacter sp. TaxID=2065818 RepID=UPI002FC2E20B
MQSRLSALFAPLLAGLLAGGLLTGGLAPNSLYAQPDTTRWTPELRMQYDEIIDTEIAPGGGHVAYVVREAVMDETTSEYRQQIHVAGVDGSFDEQFTYGEHSSFRPRWSPSGDRLAFISTRTEEPQVHVMRLRGGEPFPVTDAETGVNSFQWGPDGERIAYTMTDPKPEAERQREKEKRDVQVVDEEHRFSHLYTTDVAEADDSTRRVQRLTEGTFHVRSFDWSPDGETVVFAHQPTPDINAYIQEADLSTVPADSGAVRSLVERPGVDAHPHFSPEGQQVAFSSHGGEPEIVGLSAVSDVYVVPASGGTPEKLADTPNRDGSVIGWMDNAVLVVEHIGTSTHVLAVPSDGAAPQNVTQGDGLHGEASFDADAQRMAFTYENVNTPEEVYLSSTDNFQKRRLTNVHEDVPTPPMGRTDVLTWESPDGLEIEGLVTYPVGYEEGDQVPLVLDVHGGPAGVHTRSFTDFPQIFAQRGYAVLRPNPRGSTGYGKDFRWANIGDWGFGDFEDLMAGVDLMVDRGVAHPDSLAIMGGSYGGYMTAWAVTQTDRFAAAHMYAGMSNLISMVGTTDLPDAIFADMGGELWGRYDTYERHSPIYHVKNASTPTLIYHGAEDQRVPPSQGREFYRALKRQGVPTQLVLYPRQRHGFSEPKQSMDAMHRNLDWFDEHLGRSSSGQ